MSDGATLLRGFLDKHDISNVSASKALGVSDPTIHDWLKRIKRPVAHHRDAIAVWTCGDVPVDSWPRDEERAAVAAVRPFVPADEGSGALPSGDVAKPTGTD